MFQGIVPVVVARLIRLPGPVFVIRLDPDGTEMQLNGSRLEMNRQQVLSSACQIHGVRFRPCHGVSLTPAGA